MLLNQVRNTTLIMKKNSFNYDELIDCGNGGLFGPGNAKLPLPPMLMFDRITEINENKGAFKKGIIKAELDIKDELWLVGAKIDPAAYINQKESVNPLRFRKLLLKKKEVSKILFAISAKGQTCIPVKLFWKGHLAKLEIALAKGKKNYDKKQTKKDADIQRDQERALKKYK